MEDSGYPLGERSPTVRATVVEPSFTEECTLPELHEFFARAAAMRGLASAIPSGSVVRFCLQGDGGGTWTVVGRGDHVEVTPRHVMWVDCELACTVHDFLALVRGQLDGITGYRTGRLRIRGDVGLVLGLERSLAL